jgi:putative aldouronate transport system permease protein
MSTPSIHVPTEKRTVGRLSSLQKLKKNISRDRFLVLMVLPGLLYFIIFHYIPMYGVTIAFKDFSAVKGITGSPWVGFKWFTEFFNSLYAFRLVKNVVLLNLYNLFWSFPVPILFASYMPHFISVVVIVGMTVTFLSPNDGIVNALLATLGYERINFLSQPEWFRTIYISTEVWQGFGYNSILYLAALASIDPQLYEAAKMDGASRMRQLIHVTLPGLATTIIILLILQLGKMMSVGFEKIILLYNPATYEVSDVLSSYVYRVGLVGGEFSFAAAVELFNSVVNFILLIIFNKLSKKWTDISLW